MIRRPQPARRQPDMNVGRAGACRTFDFDIANAQDANSPIKALSTGFAAVPGLVAAFSSDAKLASLVRGVSAQGLAGFQPGDNVLALLNIFFEAPVMSTTAPIQAGKVREVFLQNPPFATGVFLKQLQQVIAAIVESDEGQPDVQGVLSTALVTQKILTLASSIAMAATSRDSAETLIGAIVLYLYRHGFQDAAPAKDAIFELGKRFDVFNADRSLGDVGDRADYLVAQLEPPSTPTLFPVLMAAGAVVLAAAALVVGKKLIDKVGHGGPPATGAVVRTNAPAAFPSATNSPPERDVLHMLNWQVDGLEPPQVAPSPKKLRGP